PEISVWDATEGLSTEAHLQRTVEVLQQRLQQAGLVPRQWLDMRIQTDDPSRSGGVGG
ncbi:MAG: hypothetical protein UZ07_CHB004001926, partial [Chlorobi bacterium OLB7]